MYLFKVSYHLAGEATPLVAWIEARDGWDVQTRLYRDHPGAIIDRITQE